MHHCHDTRKLHQHPHTATVVHKISDTDCDAVVRTGTFGTCTLKKTESTRVL